MTLRVGSLVDRLIRPYGPINHNAYGVVDNWCFAPVVQLAFGELKLLQWPYNEPPVGSIAIQAYGLDGK